MSDLWVQLQDWKPKLWLMRLAVHFSTPTILSALQQPVQKRDTLAFAEYQLAIFARHFADLLGFWPDTAAELWGEPIEVLIERLVSFAAAALERGETRVNVYDNVPEPHRRGGGVPAQLAFREAFTRAIERICERHPLSRQGQDLVIATITGVVFPEAHVDVETIRQARRRRRKRALDRGLTIKDRGDKSPHN